MALSKLEISGINTISLENLKLEKFAALQRSKNKKDNTASFEELANLAKTWPSLSVEGRKSRLSVIIKEVLAKKVQRKLKMDMTIYVDSPEEFAKCAESMPMRVAWQFKEKLYLLTKSHTKIHVKDIGPLIRQDRPSY